MAPIGVSRFRRGETERYDVFVGTVGYESRARHALDNLGERVNRVVAAPFERNHVLSYEDNYQLFDAAGSLLSPDHRYRKELAVEIESAHSGVGGHRHALRVCVDISSMSRSRLAETVLALLRDSYIDLEIDWVYSPATYDDKLLVSGPVQFNDAVPGFEGWSDPALPLYVAVGVGLEGDRTLGVLDDLEPNETFTFSPEGFNNLYDEGILKLNRDLFKLVPSRNQFSYRVEDPYVTFLKLSSLVDLWANEARIVLLPLGPKTFALMSFLIALRDDSRVSVWRLSADSVDTPVDRIAAGPILGLSTSSALARSVNHGSQM